MFLTHSVLNENCNNMRLFALIDNWLSVGINSNRLLFLLQRLRLPDSKKEKQFSRSSAEFPPDKPHPLPRNSTGTIRLFVCYCYLLSFRWAVALGPFVWPAVIINRIWRPLRVNGLNVGIRNCNEGCCFGRLSAAQPEINKLVSKRAKSF